ncbi:MAG TPA: SGNH/GDSL hydrolase family protein [Pyrinomonadaceae bacterium]|nr:SGNH/GDSL hydrolase family protein [Pyrinomonadaceae bacterium]
MKIVVMADSLAMAREGETNVPYDATYPYLLDQSLRRRFQSDAPMVIERGMRRRTIEYVLDEWYELVDLRKADVVVVHVGIVDCAPRVFLRRERQFVENLKPAFLRESILSNVHKHRRAIVNLRKKVYVPVERFNKLVAQVIERAKQSKLRSLVLVNIITPPAEMDERSPGFVKNVGVYNEILKSHATRDGVHLIDLDQMIREAGGVEQLTVDGIHINETGHALLANEIEHHVLSLVEGRN